MDLFSYLLVLVAIVIGMGMAQILSDVAQMIQHRRRVRVFWVHLVWLAIVFLMQVQYWYVLFSWRNDVSLGESFGSYLANLMFPISLYVVSVLLAPGIPATGTLDLKTYYYAQHRWIFGLCTLSILILIAHSTFYLGLPLLHPVNAVRAIAVVLLVALAWSANRVLHAVVAIVMLGLFITFVTMLALRAA